MMTLDNLKYLFGSNGCTKVYVKCLAANDNSKNQVYFGGSFELLTIFPISKIINEPAGNWEKERFKASLRFSWVNDDGLISPAPHSQLILYPKYPEVRFSGFLLRCSNAPSDLMTNRIPNRLLFLSVSSEGILLGYVASPNSEIATEFEKIVLDDEFGVFKVLNIKTEGSSKEKLLNELKRIHNLGWIQSKRFDKYGMLHSCNYSNCGGYTLEAELGIRPNSSPDADYLGWELKQFGVTNLNRIESKVITLMTPEPTTGDYVDKGVDFFIRNYGYIDRVGRVDRLNFGGVHKVGLAHSLTNLELQLIGFDPIENKIRSIDGMIALVDQNGNIAAGWSFSSLLLHWNKKHNQACFVPSLSKILPTRQYKYGDKVILGEGADFQLFLALMASGKIYYDPGIKMENASQTAEIKRRRQFRIKSGSLSGLYKKSSLINISEIN